MKVKVIKSFKDKHTKVIYQPGREIEMTQERYEELTSSALGPFVEAMEATEKKPGKKPKAKANKAKSR